MRIRNKRYRIHPIKLSISALVVLALLFSLTYGTSSIFKSCSAKNNTVTDNPTNNNVVTKKGNQQNHEIPLLVNAEHPLPAGYKKPKTVKLIGRVNVTDDNVSVAEETATPLESLMNDATAAGYGDLFVASGYRSNKLQKKLYNEAADKSYVQPPGCSEHETGLAVDIVNEKMNLHSMDNTPEEKWLYDNSWRYGFIVRYPKDKVNITGISYEPWHLRYVGKPVAKICFKEGLCLEEYIEKYA